MFDRVLGQEYNPSDRIKFLKDNCDVIEELGYTKQFDNEKIEELKDQLVDTSIQMRDVKADKKDATKMYNEQIKQLEERSEEVTKGLKEKAEFVNEPCYRFLDEEDRTVGFYNAEGLLVLQRPARPEEMQTTFKMEYQRTGTEG